MPPPLLDLPFETVIVSKVIYFSYASLEGVQNQLILSEMAVWAGLGARGARTRGLWGTGAQGHGAMGPQGPRAPGPGSPGSPGIGGPGPEAKGLRPGA